MIIKKNYYMSLNDKDLIRQIKKIINQSNYSFYNKIKNLIENSKDTLVSKENIKSDKNTKKEVPQNINPFKMPPIPLIKIEKKDNLNKSKEEQEVDFLMSFLKTLDKKPVNNKPEQKKESNDDGGLMPFLNMLNGDQNTDNCKEKINEIKLDNSISIDCFIENSDDLTSEDEDETLFSMKLDKILDKLKDEDFIKNNQSETLNFLIKIKPELELLNSMIGLDNLKEQVLDVISIFSKKKTKGSSNFYTNFAIYGKPGVGKTTFAKIITKILFKIGVVENKVFMPTLADFKGSHVGQTTNKTQKLFDKAEGGVLIVDEFYMIGAGEQSDVFSKELINTFVRNLYKRNLVVFIMGYYDKIKEEVFSLNPGLERRFPFQFHIKDYTSEQLEKIFYNKLTSYNYKILKSDSKYVKKIFEKHIQKFPHYGGSVENLISKCELCHSRRIFPRDSDGVFTLNDLKNGFSKYLENLENDCSIDLNSNIKHNTMYT